MELNDVARRVLGHHWWLIVVFVLLGIGAAGLMHRGDVEMYTASTRLVLDTPDPETRAESIAIADTAKAIATSPSQVRDALRESNVTGRNPVKLAREHVSVRALGTSGVLELSVSDRSPQAAADISNALAVRLIRSRLDVTTGEVQQILADLDKRIADLNRRISRLDAQIISLDMLVASASTVDVVNSARRRRNDAVGLRELLAQQRAVAESERVSLLSTQASRPRPSIIGRASPPDRPDSSRWLPDVVLGGLLGLILGVGLAGLIETFRPSFVGSNALAREFDTPLLGTLPGDPDEEDALVDAAAIAMRIRLAAEVANVQTVNLFSAGPHLELERFAEQLQAALDSTKSEELVPELDSTESQELVASAQGRRAAGDVVRPAKRRGGVRGASVAPRGVRIRPFKPETARTNGARAGLVLVSPTTLRKSDIDGITHTLRLDAWSVLGLVTYRQRGAAAIIRAKARSWR